MATSLLRYERFETTLPKAKELRRIVEPLIRMGSSDNLHNRRKAYSFLFDKAIVYKLFSELGPRFKNRNGGYTRIIRTRTRHGDAAEMAFIELLHEDKPTAPKAEASTKAEKKAPAKKTAAKKEAAAEQGTPKAAKEKSETKKTAAKKSK